MNEHLTRDELESLTRRLEISIKDPDIISSTVDRICDWLFDINMLKDGEHGIYCRQCANQEDLRDEINSLEDDIYELNNDKDDLEEKIEDLETDLKEAKESIAELEKENKEYIKRIEELEDEIDILECQ